jgi:hypothetical protein
MADRIGADDLIKGKVASIISRFLDDIGENRMIFLVKVNAARPAPNLLRM